ncbi:MAG: tRNA (guanosine(37)-N1)-methyltransferase TrmD, partial [Dehalococcoidia bacterium]
MQIDILTIFPGMFRGPFDESIVHRAAERGIVRVGIHDLREWAHDRHRTVDDYAFGGGPGMVMKAGPIVEAAEAVLGGESARTILLTPAGRRFDQSLAEDLSREARLLLICGHYEGVDERVRELLAAEEISIGDFVLTGGEIAAMTIVDAVVRLLPGAITEGSLQSESHGDALLEYPHYTRPAEFRGRRVPDVLLSGNHAEIATWRRRQAIVR